MARMHVPGPARRRQLGPRGYLLERRPSLGAQASMAVAETRSRIDYATPDQVLRG